MLYIGALKIDQPGAKFDECMSQMHLTLSNESQLHKWEVCPHP